MKNPINILCVIVLLFIESCDTPQILFQGPYFVRFTNTAQSEKESYSKPLEIEVHHAGPALTSDLIVTYKLSGNAREGIDYIILTERGKLTIKKGEYKAKIKLQLINNANNILRSQDFIFTLLTVDAGDLQIGQGESSIGKTFTFTIIDDCILGGTYIGTQGSTPPVPDVTITSTDCETYTLSNWNINIFNSPVEMDLKFVDNADNTITIPQQEEENLNPKFATIKGSGVVNPINRTIIMTVILVDFINQPEVSFTLTPN